MDDLRIGCIQNLQPGKTGGASEYIIEYLRREARSAHAQQDNIFNAAIGEWFKRSTNAFYICRRFQRGMQPGQPVGNLLRRWLPHMEIICPDSRGNIAAPHFIHCVGYSTLIGTE